MFGYTITKADTLEALRTEIKGYYNQETEINEYFRAIQAQLRGVDAGRIAGLSRADIRTAYETIGPVMGVINYIADNVGEVARYIELRDDKGEYIEKHWLLDLIRNPNDRFSRRKFFTAWAVNRLLFGDAFVYAPIEPGALRNISSMYVIPGQRVQIEKGGYDQPFKGIKIAGGTSGTIDLEGKVFESFDYNLDDTSFFGTSKIAAAAVYLSVMERSMNRQATALKNGGPANLVTPDAASQVAALPAQIDDMEKKLNAGKNVNGNLAMRMAVKVQKLGDGPATLSVLESHKDAINVLCFLYKVPVDLYLGQSKYENAKEAKKTIYEQIAIPMVNEFCEDLLHYVGTGAEGLELVVNTDAIEVLRDSRSDTLDSLAKMHASLNELREANGYEPISEAWADQPILPLGVQFGNEAGLDFDEE